MRACQDISDVELTSIQINVVGTLVLKVSEAQFVVTRPWSGKGKEKYIFLPAMARMVSFGMLWMSYR